MKREEQEELSARQEGAEIILKQLLGKNLLQEGFSVQQMTEVYRTNEDGRKSSSIGFFNSEDLAKVFAQQQTDASWHHTEPVFVLTDGKTLYRLCWEPALIFDSSQIELEARQKAMAKLSPEERKLLGL